MKYIITILLAISFTSCKTAKVLNLKSDKFSSREMVNGEWTKFTDWDTVNVNIQVKNPKMIFKKSVITIFQKEPLVYKVIGEPKQTTTETGNEVMLFNCKDKAGDKCHIVMIDQGKSVNLVVYYSNINLCYNVIEVK